MNEQIECIISVLEKSIIAHNKGDFKYISTQVDLIERYGLHESLDVEDENTKKIIVLAVDFFNAWADCANHDFQYYSLKVNEWPQLASELIHHLKNNSLATNAKFNEF